MPAKILKYYLAGTMGYGAGRKFAMLWNADVEAYTCNGRITRPMLMGDKLSVFTMSMVYSPIIWPVWMMTDLNYLDIYMSGKKPSDYGYDQKKTCTWDYVMG